MTFAPITLGAGIAGWNYLNRTLEAQTQRLSNDSQTRREIDQFRAAAGNIQSPRDLVSDRASLSVVLGAVGLEDDVNNRFFIEKLLREGTSEPDALANLLSDTRYRELAGRIDFSAATPFDPATVETIVEDYLQKRFEVLVGEQEPDLRLALNLQSELGEIGARAISNDAKWFTVMGSPPLRTVFEGALNLPGSISNLPIDDQLDVFKDRASAVFGQDDLARLSQEPLRSEVSERFLLQAQLAQGQTLSSGSIALSLLSGL